jgi:AcrR family transcriptional regulator
MPISDCEVRDPRIRRTRQALQGALRELMLARSIEEISVQDITDLADVNRATFYDHYNDKFGLLDAMVAGGFHKLLAERNILFDGTCPGAARAIILATCDYLVSTHSGGQCNGNSAFEPLMEAGIVTAIQRTILRGAEGKPTPEGLTPEIVATTAAWAIYGACKQWFYTPDRVPLAEIIQPILALVFPVLAAVGNKGSEASLPHPEGQLVTQ